jgi:hypothetical protein
MMDLHEASLTINAGTTKLRQLLSASPQNEPADRIEFLLPQSARSWQWRKPGEQSRRVQSVWSKTIDVGVGRKAKRLKLGLRLHYAKLTMQPLQNGRLKPSASSVRIHAN